MADALYNFLGIFGYTHPLHPVIVHLIIGPVIATPIFALIAWFFKKPNLYNTARQLNVLALVMWFPAVIVGVLDWQHRYGGANNMPEILWKSVGAGILFLIILGNILLYKKIQPSSKIHMVLYLIGAGVVGAIGMVGGDLVYGKGAGDGASHGQKTEAAQVETAPDGFKKMVYQGYTFEWKVQGELVDMKLSTAGTGWIGVGFGKLAVMQDAHIIIGYITPDGKARISDEYGNGKTTHKPQTALGAKSTITNPQGKLENGITTLSWTMPLNTGNPKDVVLTPGQSVGIIFAKGSPGAKDLTSYHGKEGRAMTQITF